MKTQDQYFADWEGSLFGYGYGTGEPHVLKALIREAETPEGMRRRLLEYARDDSLTHHVLSMRDARGLSGEDTMTLLAYHALLERERFREQLLEFYNTQPAPAIINSSR